VQEYIATVTSKGQLTLPAAVRRRLGINSGDKVTITIDGERAELQRVAHTVDSVFGIIPALPGVETGDFDDLIEEAMEDHADWVVDRMRRGLE
jgi:antitoxin PrlF